MANLLDEAVPQIISGVLEVLRENAITPRLVDNRYSNDARERGDTIDILETNQLEARDVVPSEVTPASNNDVTPKKKQLYLNNWKEVPFKMTDKEIKEVIDGGTPRMLEEAGRTLANVVDASVLTAAAGSAYQTVGVAGTSPFGGSTAEFQQASRILTTGLARKSERYVVADEFACANLLGLPVFQQVNQSGSSETLRDGMVRRAFGFDIYENQNVPDIQGVVGGAAGAGPIALAAAASVGAKTLTLDNGAGALPTRMIKAGALFTIAGSTQQYAVTSVNKGEPLAAGANAVTVEIEPALKAAAADNSALTIAPDAVGNLAFSRNAIAFASRPLLDVVPGGSIIQSVSDPVTGLSFRLEISRQHRQTYFSLDCLWGVRVVRPEQVVRILG